MKSRTQNALGIFAVVFVCYFVAYFLSVRTNYFNIKAMVVAVPAYRPFNTDFVRTVFSPAHLLDAAYLRPARWEAHCRDELVGESAHDADADTSTGKSDGDD